MLKLLGVLLRNVSDCTFVSSRFWFSSEVVCVRDRLSRVVSLLREPKTLSCARVRLKKKTECYALCFSHGSGAPEESPGAVKHHGLA